MLKIGANDGVENDPFGDILRTDERYTGILVEPFPDYANSLEQNFAETKRFTIERSAISEDDGEAPFFTVNFIKAINDGVILDGWLKGCASMDRLHLEKHMAEGCGNYISRDTVTKMSVTTLLNKHKVDRVDLLHIDTEGHDYKIIRQFDLRALSTSVVLCEKKHLSADDSLQVKKILINAGFSVHEDETDYLGIRRVF